MTAHDSIRSHHSLQWVPLCSLHKLDFRLYSVHCSLATLAVLTLVQSNTTGDFDEDPPSDFEADYEAARSEYKSEVQDYMNAVNEAAEVNQIAEDLALLVRL